MFLSKQQNWKDQKNYRSKCFYLCSLISSKITEVTKYNIHVQYIVNEMYEIMYKSNANIYKVVLFMTSM